MAQWSTIILRFGSFSTEPAGIVCHLLSALHRSDQDRAATQYAATGHVWTAPGWQEESSLCSNGQSSHVFGLRARYS
jgi:hypothetical protein